MEGNQEVYPKAKICQYLEIRRGINRNHSPYKTQEKRMEVRTEVHLHVDKGVFRAFNPPRAFVERMLHTQNKTKNLPSHPDYHEKAIYRR